jgi:serine/threonine protein kinase
MGQRCSICGDARLVENAKPEILASSESRPANNEEEEDPEATQKYFSFGEYFATDPHPRVFEYLFLNEIGKGAMSRVYMAVNESTQDELAIKVYSCALLSKVSLGADEPPIDCVRREIDLMLAFNHRYVISLIEAFDNVKTNSIMLVMPWGTGTLQAEIDEHRILQRDIPICFFQMAEALRYLHSHNVVHRDLKPDNVLLFGERYYVLSDFSVSKKLDDPDVEVDDTKGSPAFLSPEECSGNPYLAKPADVWAYGVMFYTTVFGHLPFNLESAHGLPVANTIIMVASLLESEDLAFPEELPDDCDWKVLDVIRWILVKDPEKRPTFEDIVKHEFFEPGRRLDEEYQRDAAADDAAAQS